MAQAPPTEYFGPTNSKKAVTTSVSETQTAPADFPRQANNLLIVDCGSDSSKIGFAGDSKPRLSLPTLVGKPKQGTSTGLRSRLDTYVGREALEKHAILDLNTPIERGVIQNWDNMEIYFDYMFEKVLRLDNPAEYDIVLTETLNNPTANREMLIDLMLEKYQFNSFFLASAPPLALYSYGFHTGIVVDSGDGQTHIVPVYEGLSMPNTSKYIPLGGKDIDHFLEFILSRNNETFHLFQKTNADKTFLRHIKENLCFVALDIQQELYSSLRQPIPYRLPDGNFVHLNQELCLATEPLFDPTIMNIKTGGIHENIYRSIQISDPYLKNLFYEHIVLSGGNTLFPGLRDRLDKEIVHMAEPGSRIRVHAKSDRKNAIFMGASLLASLSKFKQMMISREEYNEYGPMIMYRKCF